MMGRKSAQGALLIAALAMSATATAADPTYVDTNSVRVAFYDLDVDSHAGARELYSRLQRASRKACALNSTRVAPLSEIADARRCYQQSLSTAVGKVDSVALTSLHRS